MNSRRNVCRFAAVIACCLRVTQVVSAEVKVFAAASLTESLRQVADNYKRRRGDKIIFNFAGSSILARQIREGAPADIFFSADEHQMNALEAKGLIEKSTRKSRLSNSLVIVVAAEHGAAISAPQDLARPVIRRIALGDPKAVPIGIYAREYLQMEKLWTDVSRKIIATENVRAALAAVEAGNADASIVYKTDAAISTKVRVVFEVPRDKGPKISYPVALVADSKQKRAANEFLSYVNSADAAAVFKKFGFLVAD